MGSVERALRLSEWARECITSREKLLKCLKMRGIALYETPVMARFEVIGDEWDAWVVFKLFMRDCGVVEVECDESSCNIRRTVTRGGRA